MLTATAQKADTVLDRTLALEAAQVWPDPLACPDWPQISAANMQHMTVTSGRAPAEARLDAIGRLLNGNARQLRAPTPTEREELLAAVFKREATQNPRWHALGIRDLVSAGRLKESDAELIVEAAHIRGYLRKLDALQAQRAEDGARQELERAQRRLDGYAEHVSGLTAELESLAEAVARHEQRIADERAVRRVADIKSILRQSHHEAAQAARKLGADAPAMLEFV